MNKKFLIIFISIICGIAALVAAFTTVMVVKQKQKKEEEELEHYLDSSIQ